LEGIVEPHIGHPRYAFIQFFNEEAKDKQAVSPHVALATKTTQPQDEVVDCQKKHLTRTTAAFSQDRHCQNAVAPSCSRRMSSW